MYKREDAMRLDRISGSFSWSQNANFFVQQQRFEVRKAFAKIRASAKA